MIEEEPKPLVEDFDAESPSARRKRENASLYQQTEEERRVAEILDREALYQAEADKLVRSLSLDDVGSVELVKAAMDKIVRDRDREKSERQVAGKLALLIHQVRLGRRSVDDLPPRARDLISSLMKEIKFDDPTPTPDPMGG